MGEQEESRSSELRRTVLPSGRTQPHTETAELRYRHAGFPADFVPPSPVRTRVGVGRAARTGKDGTVISHMPSLF